MSVETLRPNATGDEENINGFKLNTESGHHHWEAVDEESQDGGSTWVASDSASYERDLYNIPDHSQGSGVINGITVHVYVKGNYANGHYKIAIKSGTGTGAPDTVSESSEDTVPYYTWYARSNQWTTNPATGSAWTWDEIDKLQIGIALKKTDNDNMTMCTQVYVEVDYGVTPKTSSDSGSGADAYVSLETGEAKSSSDTGSGVEGTPVQTATLTGNETGSGIEAPVARLLAAFDTGTGAEVGGLLKDLFASELGLGSDSLTAKIETPTKGGGMKLWI